MKIVYFKELMINKTYQLNLGLLDVNSYKRENIPTKKSDLKKAVLKEITEIKNISGENVGFKYLFELADGTIVTDSHFTGGGRHGDISIAFTLGFEYNLVASKKDINDMILAGISPGEIMDLIDKFTFSNLRANLEFSSWKKV
jgi:hypothetical protein